MIAFNVNNKEEFDAAVDYFRRRGNDWHDKENMPYKDSMTQVGVHNGVMFYSEMGWWGKAPAPTKQYYIRKFKEAYETICRG